MLRVDLICIGRLKERCWQEAADEYKKRLQGYCRLTVTELPEYRLPARPDPAQIAAALEREGESILAKLPPQSYLIALCIEGQEMDSPAFSKLLSDRTIAGDSRVTLVIGGPFGLSETVKRRADFRLSFSPMTFPHRLARVMALEQLYRAFRIASGGQYHK